MEPIDVAQRLQAMGQELLGLATRLQEDKRQAREPAELATKLFERRRARSRYFPDELFGEPGWDILLDLYIASLQDRPVSTSDPGLAAGVPSTTALRWLKSLEAGGFIYRVPDRSDGRRSFVHLTHQGEQAMERYLGSIFN